MCRKTVVPLIAVLIIISASTGITILTNSEVFAQDEQEFTAVLTGEEEVPPTDSTVTSITEFKVTGDNIQYSVMGLFSNLQDVTAGHIHSGSLGENGPVVVTLFKYDSPTKQVNENGTITADNLEGPMAGKQLSDLVTAMDNGETYVNIHTSQNPNGEIRGEIMRSN